MHRGSLLFMLVILLSDEILMAKSELYLMALACSLPRCMAPYSSWLPNIRCWLLCPICPGKAR